MITVTAHALEALSFTAGCVTAAVQQVREYASMNDKLQPGRATQLINKLLSTELTFDHLVEGVEPKQQVDFEMMVAQAVVEHVIRHVGQPIDEVEVVVAAQRRIRKLMQMPQHRWMFVKPEATTGGTASAVVAVVAGLETKVAVNSDGKIKKGGKEVLARELYKKHVLEAATPVDNKGFVQILMKELQMTKAGATTYAYNVRKQMGNTQK